MDNATIRATAKNLLNDPVVKKIFDEIKQDNLEALASVDASDTNAVLKLQSLVVGVDDILGRIETFSMLPDEE